MKNKLMFIDELLERLEDTTHGADSVDIQTARRYCLEMIGEKQFKTTEEWLQKLPEGFRDRALDQIRNRGMEQESMVEALYAFAVWNETREGHEFWSAVTRHYRYDTPLPKLP